MSLKYTHIHSFYFMICYSHTAEKFTIHSYSFLSPARYLRLLFFADTKKRRIENKSWLVFLCISIYLSIPFSVSLILSILDLASLLTLCLNQYLISISHIWPFIMHNKNPIKLFYWPSAEIDEARLNHWNLYISLFNCHPKIHIKFGIIVYETVCVCVWCIFMVFIASINLLFDENTIESIWSDHHLFISTWFMQWYINNKLYCWNVNISSLQLRKKNTWIFWICTISISDPDRFVHWSSNSFM